MKKNEEGYNISRKESKKEEINRIQIFREDFIY